MVTIYQYREELLKNDPKHILVITVLSMEGFIKLIPLALGLIALLYIPTIIFDVIKEHKFMKSKEVKPLEG